MALTPAIAQNQSLTLVQGSTIDVLLVPKNPDGTTFDATDFDNSGHISVFQNRSVPNPAYDVNLIPAAAGPTGVTIRLTPAIAEAILNVLGTSNAFYVYTCDDGTDNLNVAYGTLTVTQNQMSSS